MRIIERKELAKSSPSISSVELKILFLLSKREMHVRELRRALGNNGAVSEYLLHLEKMGLITRRELDKWVINKITTKGRQILKFFRPLI